MKPLPVLFFALVACGDQQASNAMANAQVPDGPMPAAAAALPKAEPVDPNCLPPKLDFTDAGTLSDDDRARLTDNFAVAVARSCADGLLEKGPLVDQHGAHKDTIFVINAPEANITSIYFASSASPPATVLESPFGDPPRVPSVEDLHEAIYCATKGATPEEQETSGRCLPD